MKQNFTQKTKKKGQMNNINTACNINLLINNQTINKKKKRVLLENKNWKDKKQTIKLKKTKIITIKHQISNIIITYSKSQFIKF